VFDAAGELDGHALGSVLGDLVAGRNVKLTRLTPALTDLANAGAAIEAWRTASALLAIVLPTPKPPTGTPDLLALAARLAGAAPAPATPIAGLADVAARTGTSRLITEARRLTRVLAGTG
jgi:hypothetical protein